MTISDYRRWYEITFCQPLQLTDAQLCGFPYFLNLFDVGAHAENETRLASFGGAKKSPLPITSGLLFHGGTFHD